MMYGCRNCGHIFEDRHATYKDFTEIHTETDPTSYERWTEIYCPECGSKKVDGALTCDICGDWAIKNYAEFIVCPDCEEAILRMIDYSADWILVNRRWKGTQVRDRKDVVNIMYDVLGEN